MGLQDRDWYREKPLESWPTVVSRPARSRGMRVVSLLLVAVLATAAIMGVGIWTDQIGSQSTQPGSSFSVGLGSPLGGSGATRMRPADPKIVHLDSRPGLDVPATRVSRWWVTDPRFGRIGVYVPVGTTPREALTVALAQRGYQVVR
jgi:hypothetical protein